MESYNEDGEKIFPTGKYLALLNTESSTLGVRGEREGEREVLTWEEVEKLRAVVVFVLVECCCFAVCSKP